MATFSAQCGLQIAYNLESGSISRDAFLFNKDVGSCLKEAEGGEGVEGT